ncbi:MAG: hypothetical protein OEZ06_20995 [Myxococcales bacterium]|nr:hypothetical protein [Myxococcales bacterium]
MTVRDDAKRGGWLLFCAALVLAATFGAPSISGVEAQAQRRKPKVIQLEEIKIEGRVQKPNAFYILNRSNLGYKVMELQTSFINEVVRAVRRDPF